SPPLPVSAAALRGLCRPFSNWCRSFQVALRHLSAVEKRSLRPLGETPRAVLRLPFVFSSRCLCPSVNHRSDLRVECFWIFRPSVCPRHSYPRTATEKPKHQVIRPFSPLPFSWQACRARFLSSYPRLAPSYRYLTMRTD